MNNDLISRNSVIELLKKWSDGYCYIEIPTEDAIYQITKLPPVDLDNIGVIKLNIPKEVEQKLIEELRKVPLNLAAYCEPEYTEEDMKRTIKENFDLGYEMAKNKYERPKGEIIKCKDCKHRVKEWRVDKRMKDKGYWVYGCKHFGEIMGYWGWGGYDDEFCSDAEKADMRSSD